MFEKDLLKGRTILITGGGTGLGRSMALRFAELGATLFLVGRREEPLRQTIAEIRGLQSGGSEGAPFEAQGKPFASQGKQAGRGEESQEAEESEGVEGPGAGESGASGAKAQVHGAPVMSELKLRPPKHRPAQDQPPKERRASPSTRRSLRDDAPFATSQGKQGKQGKPFEAQGKATYACADVRDFTAVEAAIATAEREFGVPFGGIDTLVNNAAGNFLARTEKLSPNAFNAVVGIVLGRVAVALKPPLTRHTTPCLRLRVNQCGCRTLAYSARVRVRTRP